MSDRLPTHEINTALVRMNYGLGPGEDAASFATSAVVTRLCDAIDEYRGLVEALYAVVPNGWRYCLTEPQQALFEAVHAAAYAAELEADRRAAIASGMGADG